MRRRKLSDKNTVAGRGGFVALTGAAIAVGVTYSIYGGLPALAIAGGAVFFLGLAGAITARMR